MALSHFALALALTGDGKPAHRRLAAQLFDELGDDGVPAALWTTRWSSTTAGEQ